MSRIPSTGAVLAFTCVTASTAGAYAASSADPDGRYGGKLGGAKSDSAPAVSFSIARDGRELRGFTATLAATCVTGVFPVIEIQVVAVRVPRATLRPNGSFAGTYKPTGETTITYRGTVKQSRTASGHVEYASGICRAKSGWSAVRAGA